MTDENILEGYMDDALWHILDTINFYDYQPQEEFSYVPGTYSKGAVSTDHVVEDEDGEEDADEDADEAGTGAAAAAEPADTTAAPAAEIADATAAPAAEIADPAAYPAAEAAGTSEEADEEDEDEIVISPEEAEEKAPIFWGSFQMTEKNTVNSYEYDVEGDYLYLNIGGNWIEYEKT